MLQVRQERRLSPHNFFQRKGIQANEVSLLNGSFGLDRRGGPTEERFHGPDDGACFILGQRVEDEGCLRTHPSPSLAHGHRHLAAPPPLL